MNDNDPTESKDYLQALRDRGSVMVDDHEIRVIMVHGSGDTTQVPTLSLDDVELLMASAWEEGWIARVCATLPDATPIRRLMYVLERMPAGNPYRQGDSGG